MQAALLLQWHPESVRRAIRDGRLKANRSNQRTILIPQAELERFMRERDARKLY
jgi:excisionase family DNA binding protein